MTKRFFDILCSALGLLIASPIFLLIMFLVWRQDFHTPFYIAPRIGRNGQIFSMVKMRSMLIDADRNGVSSTSNIDDRITSVGHFIRRYKIDELTQLWNVLIGDMSLVGPRPQVQSGVDLYTECELALLTVKPGITDFASIVFSDEGAILIDHPDPDLGYEQLIRPGKSALGLFYIQHHCFNVDLRLIFLTLVAIFSRERALRGVQSLLRNMGADEALIELAGRRKKLVPSLPPGAVKDKDFICNLHSQDVQ